MMSINRHLQLMLIFLLNCLFRTFTLETNSNNNNNNKSLHESSLLYSLVSDNEKTNTNVNFFNTVNSSMTTTTTFDDLLISNQLNENDLFKNTSYLTNVNNINNYDYNVNNNNNNNLVDDSSSDILSKILLSMIFIPIILATLIGNTLVILAVIIVRKLRTQDNGNNILIVSLAVSDFLVGVFAMPFAYYVQLSHDNKWYLGAILCDLWILSDVLLCTASILNLCAISIDRYCIILHAMVYTQRRNVKLMMLMILAVWVISALISIPPLLGWGKPSADVDTTRECGYSTDLKYQIFATFLAFYLPLIVMIIIYINIYRAAKKIKKREMETAGHLHPSSFLPESITNIRIQADAAHHANQHPFNHQQSVQSNNNGVNNYVHKKKRSTSSSSSIPLYYNTYNTTTGNNFKQNCKHTNHQINIKENPHDAHVTQIQQQPQQVLVSLKKSDSDHGSIESKIYHSTSSSQDNTKEKSNNNDRAATATMVVSSQSAHQTGSHVTVNAISGQTSRRSSFGAARKFGRRLTQAFSGIKRPSGTSSSHGKNKKATKTLGVIMGCFILCWLPFFILAIVKPFQLSDGRKVGYYIPKWFDSLLLWLGYFNSALNPMIYARFNREFRRPFIEILCFRCRGINDKLRDEDRRRMIVDNTNTNMMHYQRNSTTLNPNTLNMLNNNSNRSLNLEEKSEDEREQQQLLVKAESSDLDTGALADSVNLNVNEFKKHIESERSKFYGLDKPALALESTPENDNENESPVLNSNANKSKPTARTSIRSKLSPSLKRQSNMCIDDSIVTASAQLDSHGHRMSNDTTIKAESLDVDDQKSAPATVADNVLVASKSYSNSLQQGGEPITATSNEPSSQKNLIRSETVDEPTQTAIAAASPFAKNDRVEKLKNSSTKSSLNNNNKSSSSSLNKYDSSNSIFHQIEQSISSIISSNFRSLENDSFSYGGSSSIFSKNLSSLASYNPNLAAAAVNIDNNNNNSPTANKSVNQNELASSSSNNSNRHSNGNGCPKVANSANSKSNLSEMSLPFSSVYSFETAPTSPVNLKQQTDVNSLSNMSPTSNVTRQNHNLSDDDDDDDGDMLDEEDDLLDEEEKENLNEDLCSIQNEIKLPLLVKSKDQKSETSRQRKLLNYSSVKQQSADQQCVTGTAKTNSDDSTTSPNLSFSKSKHSSPAGVAFAYCTSTNNSTSNSNNNINANKLRNTNASPPYKSKRIIVKSFSKQNNVDVNNSSTEHDNNNANIDLDELNTKLNDYKDVLERDPNNNNQNLITKNETTNDSNLCTNNNPNNNNKLITETECPKPASETSV